MIRATRFLTDLRDDDEIGCKLDIYTLYKLLIMSRRAWTSRRTSTVTSVLGITSRPEHLENSHQEGLDFLADIHGDEEIENNFLAGNEGH